MVHLINGPQGPKDDHHLIIDLLYKDYRFFHDGEEYLEIESDKNDF